MESGAEPLADDLEEAVASIAVAVDGEPEVVL